MANEPIRSEEAKREAGTGAAFSDRRRNLITVALVGGLMILEGVGIVVAVKLSGGAPSAARAAGLPGAMFDADGNPLPEQSEVHISDVVAFNNSDGRPHVYQITVYALVDTRSRDKLEDFFTSHNNMIDDRLSRAIRAADSKYFTEPDLQTIRRQFKSILDELLGDQTLLKEILIPEFSKSRAD